MALPVDDSVSVAASIREPRPVRPLTLRVVVTLAGWSVAYVVVLALLYLAGPWLESRPPALDALIFTGILVPLMGNFVMPTLARSIGRLLVVRPPER